MIKKEKQIKSKRKFKIETNKHILIENNKIQETQIEIQQNSGTNKFFAIKLNQVKKSKLKSKLKINKY